MSANWIPEPLVGQASICVGAPSLAISSVTGQIDGGIDGYYHADRRLVARMSVSIDGREPEQLRQHRTSSSSAQFISVHRMPADNITGPTVTLERRRSVETMDEWLTIRNNGREQLVVCVVVTLASDLADMSEVRSGRGIETLPAQWRDGGLGWTASDGVQAWVQASPAPDDIRPVETDLRWQASIPAGGCWEVRLSIGVSMNDTAEGFVRPKELVAISEPELSCPDPRFEKLLTQGLADTRALVLAPHDNQSDQFVSAGAPWYLTLFGRDCIWAARMLLPLGTNLAAGTLRTLARCQGTRYDPRSEEAPGKIVHEVRNSETQPYEGLSLPPLYYGTIDATPLFVTLLAEAWRWGMPAEQVRELLPAAERALEWLRSDSDPDGDGFAEYISSHDKGLANQGWKDTADAIQFADGRLAKAPIALSEVQGYMYEAALNGAELLAAFGRPGHREWTEWAAELRERFQREFWIDDPDRPFVAVALDGDKVPVDSVTSNMAHLLNTGILSETQIKEVSERLSAEDMDSGWGIRTFSSELPGFNALSYHCGTVWAHDTAIAATALAASRQTKLFTSLLNGLLAAAAAFDYRLPEVWGGEQRTEGSTPLPYPGACRPQAWAAGSVVLLISALLGIRPDVPRQKIAIRPVRPFPFEHFEISGLRVAGQRLSLRMEAGELSVLEAPDGLEIELG